ncbi:MAG: hypothetical protein IKV86_06760 [Clostridia bacterium]|nr:hypothetical protein [Clostridia bacterium]
MKKLLALLIVLTMVIGIMPVVSAAIPQNNGLGSAATFKDWGRNSPSSGAYCGVTSVDDATFGKVTRYEAKGVANGNNYTQYKSFINFNMPEGMTAPVAGDKVMVSFYYRINTDGDNVAPLTFSGSSSLNKNATTGRNFGDVSKVNEWQYVSYIAGVDSTLYGEPSIRQVVRFTTSKNTDKVSIDIADPKAVYMGAVTAEGDVTANAQIESALSTTAITSLTVDGTAVDLTANPTTYTTEEDITAESIAVATRYGAADKVVVDVAADGLSATVKVYAPYINWMAADAVPSATYTIEKLQVKDPVVTVTENNGYGTGVVMAYETPAISTNAAREYNSLDVIKGDEAAPFDEYYSWTREEFEIEGTSNGCYISVSGTLPEGAKAGDWVYVSLYYRVYNRFTNSAGEVVDGSSMDVTPAIRSDGNDNPLYIPGTTTKYIRMTPDAESQNDVGEWKKITYIQKLTYDTNESWTFKLTNNYKKNATEGTLSCTNRKVDFADIKVVYFGTPTSDTPDTDDSFYVEAIQNAAGNYGLSKAYVNGEEIDFITNPLSYTTLTTPRYTAREKHSVVTGDTIHGAGMANVVETDAGFAVKSYPLDYDWLSGTDNRVATYTVNEVAEYDFYDFALNGNTFTLKADNGLNTVKNGVIILASYNANGKMLKMKAEPFSINGLGNTLSVTVPEAEGVASMKLYVWDGIASSVPYVKTIVINDITTGNIIQ